MSEEHPHFEVGTGVSFGSGANGGETVTTTGKHAVIVVHGMGQQSTFSTVASVADILCREERRRIGRSPGPGTATSVQIGDTRLSRIELALRDESGEEREVHLYESYWAPLTEGRVTLRDVMRFLIYAGIGGLRASLRSTFPRWSFGGMQRYPVARGTWFFLLAALALVMALMTMNAVVVATGTATILSPAANWPDGSVLGHLNAIAGTLALLMLTFFATLNAAARSRTSIHVTKYRALFSTVGWAHAGLIAVAIITAALLMVLEFRPAPMPGAGLSAALSAASGQMFTMAVVTLVVIAMSFGMRRNGQLVLLTYASIAWSALVVGAVVATAAGRSSVFAAPLWAEHLRWGWWLLVGATLVVRKVLVEFVGDVAVYVTPQNLDKFNDLREEIKACALKVAKAVYSAATDGVFEYGQITVVGHSLGSVVAYDMLNRLLRDDGVGVTRLGVERRTRALLTFGSPLDKIAFLFGMRHENDAAHALAATIQPMIQKGVRQFEWINIHSRHDVVSGSLEYFNDPAGQKSVPDVVNESDDGANTPLVAHVEYWSGVKLGQHLHRLATTVRSLAPVTVVAPPSLRPAPRRLGPMAPLDVQPARESTPDVDPLPQPMRPRPVPLLLAGLFLVIVSLFGMYYLDLHKRRLSNSSGDDAHDTITAKSGGGVVAPPSRPAAGTSLRRAGATLALAPIRRDGFFDVAWDYLFEQRESMARQFFVRLLEHLYPMMFVIGSLMVIGSILLSLPVRDWIAKRFDSFTNAIAGRLDSGSAAPSSSNRRLAQMIGMGGVAAAGAIVSVAAFHVGVQPDDLRIRATAPSNLEMPMTFTPPRVSLEAAPMTFRLTGPDNTNIPLQFVGADGAGVQLPTISLKLEGTGLNPRQGDAAGSEAVAEAIDRYTHAARVNWIQDAENWRTVATRLDSMEKEIGGRATIERVDRLDKMVEADVEASRAFNETIGKFVEAESNRAAGTRAEAINIARSLLIENDRAVNILMRRRRLDQNCLAFKALAAKFEFLDEEACTPRPRFDPLKFWRTPPLKPPYRTAEAPTTQGQQSARLNQGNR